ncbi:MAG: cytochrome c family protein [Hyphomicrobium sp.]|nr:cytochrome c family protein [Hyphomicrobium sp.]
MLDSFELSKIGGAVLSALLLIVGTKVLIESHSASHGHNEAGYTLPTDTAAKSDAPVEAHGAAPAPAPAAGAPATPPTAAAAAPAAPAPAASAPAAAGGFDPAGVVALLKTASADDGKAAFRKCATCHVSEAGKASTAGPNLWGIVNRAKAGQADFTKYSDAMKSKGGAWSYENLASFLHKPQGYVKGTKMVFNGIGDNAELANLIAYLRTLSDSPAPLPN